MERQRAIRTIFIGLAIALFAWWATDGRLSAVASDFYFAYWLRDLIRDFVEYGLGFILGGATALYGAYRLVSGPRPFVSSAQRGSVRP